MYNFPFYVAQNEWCTDILLNQRDDGKLASLVGFDSVWKLVGESAHAVHGS